MNRLLLLSLVFAARLHAQDAPAVARMVHDVNVDASVLGKAVQSTDPLVRATGARVALVRDVRSLVPALRAQLGSEANPEAARELVRALVILGAEDDAAYAASQLQRFPATIDAAFADAVLRTSLPYDRWRAKLRAFPLPVLSTSKRPDAERPVAGIAMPVKPALFIVPLVLPRGLGAAILRDTRCRAGWVGVADIARDAVGRVQKVDTRAIAADGACTKAFRTIARLSLAEPGPPAETPLLVYRADGGLPCFDEAAVSNAVPPMGGEPTPPKVLRRVEPRYPRSAIGKGGGTFSVVAKATITSEGCVRDLVLVQQTIHPELNRAALESLAKWTFTPGTLNGVPVDVLFNLTITFRH